MAAAIKLSSSQLSMLSSIAKSALPNESCAFLLGQSAESKVVEILPMTNADSSPYSFSIEPAELLAAYDTAEKKGLHVIGIFHSHPGKSSPSATDLKFMELNPVVWVIYSTTEGTFGAYLNDDGIIDIDLMITE
ncbi:MAG TPA: M67 family metallopeptidase [Nitrososphaera sp.]|nr:M67 family metallopeptidase [Nitrososphaera sp.]